MFDKILIGSFTNHISNDYDTGTNADNNDKINYNNYYNDNDSYDDNVNDNSNE